MINMEYLAGLLNDFIVLQALQSAAWPQHLSWVDRSSPLWFQCYNSDGLSPLL